MRGKMEWSMSLVLWWASVLTQVCCSTTVVPTIEPTDHVVTLTTDHMTPTPCDKLCSCTSSARDSIIMNCNQDSVDSNRTPKSHVTLDQVRHLSLIMRSASPVDLTDVLCDMPDLQSLHIEWFSGELLVQDACKLGLMDQVSLAAPQWPPDGLNDSSNAGVSLLTSLCPHISKLNLNINSPGAWDLLISSNCTGLGLLDLSFNTIHEIPNNVLDRLPRLRTLDLSHNLLVELNVFSGQFQLEGLAKLNLSHNLVEGLAAGLFVGLPNLKQLDISHNLIRQIESGVFTCHLRELNMLDISYNQLTSIEAATLVDLSLLQVLNLSHNNLSYIDDMAVMARKGGNCTSLEEMGGGRDVVEGISSMNVTQESVAGLEEDDGKGVVWEGFHTLDLSHNNLSWIGQGILRGPMRLLRVLLLGHNHIAHLPHYAIERLHNLHTLSLTHNKLFWLDVGTFNNEKLEYVDLSYNKLKKIISMAFLYLPKIRKVDLSHNDLNYIYKFAFYRTCKYDQDFEVSFANNALETDTIWRLLSTFRHLEQTACHLRIDLSSNNITHFVQDVDRIYNVYVQTHNFRYFAAWNHVQFDLADNPIVCDCTLYNEVKLLSHIQYAFSENISHADNLDFWQGLNCSNSQAGSVPAVLDTMKCTAVNVRCPHLCQCQQHGHGALTVNCSGQRLTHVPMLPHAPNIALHLDHNSIYELMDAHHLSNVTVLDLSHNALSGFGADAFEQMPHLTALHLHHNHLHHIPPGIQNLENLTTLSIHNNPLDCGCSDAWLAQWLTNNSHLVHHGHLADVLCDSGTRLMDTEFCADAKPSTGSGPHFLFLYMGLATLAALAVLLTAIVSFFLCRKTNWYTSLTGQPKHQDMYKHDLFICYSPEDCSHFYESLVTCLVDLCPHICIASDVNKIEPEVTEKDISAHVAESRCTVIALSPCFIKNSWNLYMSTLLNTLPYSGPHNLVFINLQQQQQHKQHSTATSFSVASSSLPSAKSAQSPSSSSLALSDCPPELVALLQDYPVLTLEDSDNARLCAGQLLSYIWEAEGASALGSSAQSGWEGHTDRATLVPTEEQDTHQDHQRY